MVFWNQYYNTKHSAFLFCENKNTFFIRPILSSFVHRQNLQEIFITHIENVEALSEKVT